ncbi:MAG: glycosyltransferase family 39 protein [Weeksellaceae bacterium]|nr:glycosyltransferase family 39 protein [Weeksellaceae bacterium]
MSSHSQKEYFYYLLLLLVSGVLCFINLGGHPIYILDEAKNAEAAREMFVSNNWLLPTFNGELRTDKPPLHYWFMLISYKIFGVSAFSARFFSAIFGVLTLLSTYHFTKKFAGQKTAVITAFILSSSLFFMQEFHLAVPDPYLIFFISFGLFHFYDFYKEGKRSSWLIFYLSFGLGILAKGPIAVILPGLIILIFLLSKKEMNRKMIGRINPFLGGLLTLAIAVPWFIWIHKATNGAFTQGFFWQHNVQRFSSEMEGHGGLPFITWAFVLLGLLPFSFFIIQGFIQSWKKRKSNDYILFSFLVASVFIVFFSISNTKLPNYPMPSYPFIAVLIAVFLKEVTESSQFLKSYKISLWILFGITILLPAAAYFIFSKIEVQLYNQRFLSLFLVLLPIGSFIALIYLKQKKIKQSILAIGLSAMILCVSLFQFIYPGLTNQSPLVLAKEVMNSQTPAILYKGYDPAFLFNFERNFPFAENKEQVLHYLSENPDGIVITKEKFYHSDWEEIPTEVLLKQKAVFENYTLLIFRLK